MVRAPCHRETRQDATGGADAGGSEPCRTQARDRDCLSGSIARQHRLTAESNKNVTSPPPPPLQRVLFLDPFCSANALRPADNSRGCLFIFFIKKKLTRVFLSHTYGGESMGVRMASVRPSMDVASASQDTGWTPPHTTTAGRSWRM